MKHDARISCSHKQHDFDKACDVSVMDLGGPNSEETKAYK